MQHFKTLRIISLILVFALVTFGCAISKNNAANADFGINAETVPEGILLTLSNIPSDATHLWISVISWGDTEEQVDHYSAYANITDTSVQGRANSTQQLEKVRQNGKIIFPILQAGIKYRFTASVFNDREFRDNFMHRNAYTDIVADNGIYFNRSDVKFELNDTYSVVTISSEPKFSSDVIFDDQKYSFSVRILVEDMTIGVADHHYPDGLAPDGLTWAFEPQMTDDIRIANNDRNWLEIGSYYSAWAEAYTNIIYDDIKWCIEIAKTPEFNYSL